MSDKTTAAKNVQHPHSKLKTQKEYKKITDSKKYKTADHEKQTQMLGGDVYTELKSNKGGKEKAIAGTYPRKKREKEYRDMGYGKMIDKGEIRFNELKKGGRVKKRKNTRRENRLEELGRVDAEKAYSRKGKRNLKSEKKRIVRELHAEGGRVGSRGVAIKGFGKEIR